MKFSNLKVFTSRELTHIKKVTLMSEDRVQAAPAPILPCRTSSPISSPVGVSVLCAQCPRPGQGLLLEQALTENGIQHQTAMPFTPVSFFIHLTQAHWDSSWEHRFGRWMNNSRKGFNLGTVDTLYSLHGAVLCTGGCPAPCQYSPPTFIWSNQKCLQTFLTVPWEGKSFPVENQHSR